MSTTSDLPELLTAKFYKPAEERLLEKALQYYSSNKPIIPHFLIYSMSDQLMMTLEAPFISTELDIRRYINLVFMFVSNTEYSRLSFYYPPTPEREVINIIHADTRIRQMTHNQYTYSESSQSWQEIDTEDITFYETPIGDLPGSVMVAAVQGSRPSPQYLPADEDIEVLQEFMRSQGFYIQTHEQDPSKTVDYITAL